MPSREVVDVPLSPVEDDETAAAAQTAMITERSFPAAELTTQFPDESAGAAMATTTDKPADVPGRKITPAPATDKKEGKNKGKQQRTLASFFGVKSKVPPTPHAGEAGSKQKKAKTENATTKKVKLTAATTKESQKPEANDAASTKPKKKPATKKASSSVQSTTTKSGASTNTALIKNSDGGGRPVLRNKMDFKDMIVGNLNKNSVVKSKPKGSPSSSKSAKTVEDSFLPHIPPVSAVLPPPPQQKEPSTSATNMKATPAPKAKPVSDDKSTTAGNSNHSIQSAPSRDESESGRSEMGAVKSQLVHLFENPPAETATGAANTVVFAETAVNQKKPAPETEVTEITDKIDAAKEADKTEDVELINDEQQNTTAKDCACSPLPASPVAQEKTASPKLESSPERDVNEEPESSPSSDPKTAEKGVRGFSMEVPDTPDKTVVASEDPNDEKSGNKNPTNESKDGDQANVSIDSKTGNDTADAGKTEKKTSPSKEAEEKIAITLGAIFVKKFGKHGYFVGKVTALPTEDNSFYSVFYEADGDKEQLTEKQLSRLINSGPSKKKRKEIEQGIGDPHTVAAKVHTPATATTTPTVKNFFGTSAVSKMATKKATVSKTRILATPQAVPVVQLNAEMQALLTKHQRMKASHIEKAKRMVEQGRKMLDSSDDIEVTLPSTENIPISGAVTEFPDDAVPHLLVLLEGSKLPLSKLAQCACDALNKAFPDATFPLDVVSAKTKVLSTRKPTIKNPEVALGTTVSNSVGKDVDIFEDVNPDHIWRWEVTSIDLLPEDNLKVAKQARSTRRKITLPFNATARLLAALDESITLLEAPKTQPLKTKVDKIVGKISREEGSVLKFEQEAEKARLAAEIKKQKQEKKLQATKEEEEKKKAAELEKKKEAEQRKREKEEAKQQKERERDEAKRQKEEKARAEEAKKIEAEKKRKKRMMSFFSAGGSKKAKKNDEAMQQPAEEKGSSDLGIGTSDSKPRENVFDSKHFRSNIDSGGYEMKCKSEFSTLSNRASTSRRLKTERVNMRVFVSGESANDPFAAQPAFAEERIVRIRNRNKFLKFAEDCRPPYHGTWSKVNKRLGRNPFLKDATLNYDVDSEAEWEEGDDDPGEDVENDVDDEDEKLLDEDEEGDTRVYNYQDGWLAQDDELVEDADVDEETRELYKATNKKRKDVVDLVPVCMVAPADGGIPIVDCNGTADPGVLASKIEGFPIQDALELIRSHHAVVLADAEIFLDAFPPALTDEREESAEKAPPQSSEPTDEDLRVVARFVHHSPLVSKSVVIEELRVKHPDVTTSRAQAQRVLDSIAEKKRHSKLGVYWEVKQEMVDKLGLSDELKPMKLPEPEPPKKKESVKRKNSDSFDKGAEPEANKQAKTSPLLKKASKEKGSAKKQAKPVSAASAKLLQGFLIKKKKK